MWKPQPEPDWLLRIYGLFGPRKPQPVLVGAMVGGVVGLFAVDDPGGFVFGMIIGGLVIFVYRQLR